MPKFATKALLTACAIALFATGVQAGYTAIKSEAAFQKAIVGKTLLGENGLTLVVKADGTFAGSAPNLKFKGAWKWSGKYWCRSLYLSGKKQDDDCQTWAVDGNKYLNVREKGKGKKNAGMIK